MPVQPMRNVVSSLRMTNEKRALIITLPLWTHPKFRNERDPIDHVRKILVDEKTADEAELKAVDAEIRKIVTDAAEFAQHSPEPDPSELWTDVLVEV